MQDFYVKVGNSRNTIQFGIDIKNLGNLLNNKWGIYKRVSTNGNSPLKFATNEKGAIIRDENGDFMYNMNKNGSQKLTETFMNYQGFASTSSVQFSIRYIFN